MRDVISLIWVALVGLFQSRVAPRYIIRDRDAVYGDVFIRRLRAMGARPENASGFHIDNLQLKDLLLSQTAPAESCLDVRKNSANTVLFVLFIPLPAANRKSSFENLVSLKLLLTGRP
jgi:hypothetical protein